MKSLRLVFKVFYSEQAFWDFLLLVTHFPLSVKKMVYKSFVFLNIEKEFEKINL